MNTSSINNLREKFPSNAIYVIGASSVEVMPDFKEDPSIAVGTLAPGQQVFIEAVVILPEWFWPDWWVWGSIATDNTPKYICLRKPIRHGIPKEPARVLKKLDRDAISYSDLALIQALMEEIVERIRDIKPPDN